MQSRVATGFWSEVGELKLHHLKLGEGPVPVTAHYAASNDPHNPSFLGLEEDSVLVGAGTAPGAQPAGAVAQPADAPGGGGSGRLAVGGQLFCLNTREQLAKFDRKAAVAKVRRGLLHPALLKVQTDGCRAVEGKALGAALQPLVGNAIARLQVAAEVWEAIQSGAAEASPTLLQRLVLLCYCDLKHYRFHYW